MFFFYFLHQFWLRYEAAVWIWVVGFEPLDLEIYSLLIVYSLDYSWLIDLIYLFIYFLGMVSMDPNTWIQTTGFVCQSDYFCA